MAYGVVSGLAVLTRPDLLIFVLVGAMLFSGVRAGLLRAVGAAGVVAGPWHLFSWFALGSAVPDTLLIKTGQGTWASFAYGNGWQLYLDVAPAAAVTAFLPVVAGLVALLCLAIVGRQHPVLPAVSVAGVGAAGHYAAYALLSPPPYHWYYAPLVSGMTICLVLVVGAAIRRGRAFASVAGAVAVALALPMVWLDVSVGPLWERAPLSSNWASNAQYEAIATDLREIVGPAGVYGPGEIGALAYYCRCTVVDQFSDRGIMVDEIAAREARSGPVTRALLTANYTHLDRTQTPLSVGYRLVFEAGQVAQGDRQWPVDHWAEGASRMVLVEEPR